MTTALVILAALIAADIAVGIRIGVLFAECCCGKWWEMG